MGTLFSVLPGLREIRAPLAGGYVWLAAGWLIWGDALPTEDDAPIYHRFAELIHALGPIGIAVLVSIMGYLIGSLVQSTVTSLRAQWMKFIILRRYLKLRRDRDGVRMHRGKPSPEAGQLFSLAELWELIPGERGAQMEWPLPFLLPVPRLEASWDHAVRRAVEEPRRQVRASIRQAVSRSGGEAQVRYTYEGGRRVVEVPQPGGGHAYCPIPETPRGPIGIRQDSLASGSQRVWNKMEQLAAEADLREAIALPLFVLTLILADQVGHGWIWALVVPIALMLQRSSFLRRNAWLSVAAIQASVGTPDLERIAPPFLQYRLEAEELTEAIASGDWSRTA